MLNFQARLLATSGALVADGTYNIQFNIYNVSSGGTTLWTETYLNNASQGVTVKNGYFNVRLGLLDSLADETDINWNEELWLGMTVRGTGSCSFGACTPADAEMSPRIQLTAVPFAFQAQQLAQTSGTDRGVLKFLGVTNDPVIYLPDASGTVCLDNNNCGFVTTTNTFLQGGNDFNATAVLGTTDADALNIITNNTTRLSITSAGATTITAGTSGNPVALTVNNSTSTGAILVLQDNGGPVFTVANGGDITATGNLAVEGTGASSFAGTLHVDFDQTNDGSGPTEGLKFGGATSGEGISSKKTAGGNQYGLDFWTDGAARLSIDSMGEVGINTTSPQALLHSFANGAAVALRLEREFENYVDFNFQATVVGSDAIDMVLTPGTSTSAGYLFKTYSGSGLVDALAIDKDGKVGIGDATPDARLDVESTGAVTATGYGQRIENLQTNVTTDGVDKYGLYVASTGSFTGSGGTATNNYGLFVAAPTGGDKNYAAVLAGRVGLGGSGTGASDYQALNVLETFTASNTSTTGCIVGCYGVYTNVTVDDTASDNGLTGHLVQTSTAATAFTVSDVRGIQINNGTKGAGSTITNNTGMWIEGQTKGTNNAGLIISEATGTNQSNLVIGPTAAPSGTYSIYNSSTDQNYFAGILGIGDPSPDARLDVEVAAPTTDVVAINATSASTTDGVDGLALSFSQGADAAADINYGINLAVSTTGNHGSDILAGIGVVLTNASSSSGKQYGMAVTNADDAANATTEALVVLDNLETTANTVTDYLLINTSTTDTTTDAIDVSDSGFFNAINIGTNFLVASGDSINDFTGNGLEVSSNALQVRLDTTAADGSTTTSVSGLEFVGGELSLIRGCSANQVLKWDNTNFDWDCANDNDSLGAPRLDQVLAATAGSGVLDHNTNTIEWNWDFTTAATDSGIIISESSNSTNGTQDQQALLEVITLTNSTASPLQVTAGGTDVGDVWFDLTGAADFIIRDGGTDFATFYDAGGITFSPQSTSDITFTLDDDSSFISTGAVTNDGFLHDINLTLGADADVDTVAALNIDVTSANTGDADNLFGLQIGNLSSADSTVKESAISIGTGWDNGILFNDTTPAIKLGATDNTAELSIVDNAATPNNLLLFKDLSTNFGAYAESGAFIDRNSYFGDEFQRERADVSVDTTANVWGDDTAWSVDETATTGDCSWATVNDVVNGITQIQNDDANSICNTYLGDTAAGGTHLAFDADNLPVLLMKVKPSHVSANDDLWVGLQNATTLQTNDEPDQGIFFTNADGTTWTGVVKTADGARTAVTCTSQTVSTTNFALLKIEVVSTSNVRFYVDTNTADGVSWVFCGSATTGANIPTVGLTSMLKWTSTTITRNLQVDFFRVWQDDNEQSPEPITDRDQPGDDTEAAGAPLVSDSPDTASQLGVIDFLAATSDDQTFDNDVYVRGTLYADKIKANQIEGMEILTDRLSSLYASVEASDDPSDPDQETEEFTINLDNLTVQTFTVAVDLNVNGALFANGGLTVGGPAEFKGDTIFRKLVNFVDKVIFRKDVSFEGRATFSNDAGGFAVLKKDQQEVEVKFAQPYETLPVVTVNIKNGVFTKYVYADLTPEGFKIKLEKPATQDIEFAWTALSIKDAKTAEVPPPPPLRKRE